jgi:hypothetical protein
LVRSQKWFILTNFVYSRKIILLYNVKIVLGVTKECRQAGQMGTENSWNRKAVERSLGQEGSEYDQKGVYVHAKLQNGRGHGEGPLGSGFHNSVVARCNNKNNTFFKLLEEGKSFSLL